MNPIMSQIGTVFIPVSNIEQARDWYCDLLGIKPDGEILYGHLYILPFDGTGIVLDSQIFSSETIYKEPAFHFNTKSIEESFKFVKEKGIEVICEIQGNWFNFKDPDGNALMVCMC